MRKYYVLLIVLFNHNISQGQDIDDLMNEIAGKDLYETTATFKSTHVVTGHSVELMKKGQLDFRIAHRFGQLNSGYYNLWGLDEAHIHFGFDLGVMDWLMVGIGRGTYEKTYDGLLKFKLTKQREGENSFPISISILNTMSANTLHLYKPGKEYLTDRLSYAHQVLVARKFNDRFSFQLAPSYVHKNIVPTELDPNDTFSVGLGGRFKLSKRVSVNMEYYYVVPPVNDFRSLETYNPLSIGFDIETGGHVFQVFLSNSVAMIEKGFITETTGNWLDGGVHIGFNVSRVFSLY